MKKFYPSNFYITHYNGEKIIIKATCEKIIIKATCEEMEFLLRNDPKMTSDYSMLEVYKLEKHEKPHKGTA